MTALSNFATAQQIGTGATVIELSTSAENKFVGQLTFTNTSASAVVVTVYKILTSGTETSGSGGNWLIQRTVQPNRTWNTLYDVGNIVIGPSQTLSATAGTGSVINAECSGTVET
jgi:hypothetical protein